MTIIDEILTIANQLANEGKQPSVALVKTRLTTSVPLPTLIKTLKSWQHDPEFTTLKSSQPHCAIKEESKAEIDEKLSLALAPVLSELKEIKQLLKQIVDKQ